MIDATGYQSLKEIINSYKSRHIHVIISGIKDDLKIDFKKNGMFLILEKEFVVKDITSAINKAKEHL